MLRKTWITIKFGFRLAFWPYRTDADMLADLNHARVLLGREPIDGH